MRIVVFASGSGSNLEALLDRCSGDSPAQITMVVSDRQTAEALARAQRHSVATHVLNDASDESEILRVLEHAAAELVVLAGYVKLVPPDVVSAYAGRIVNIHPGLLPAFGGKGMYGRRVHEAVLESGATVSGPTVHLVTEQYDRGPIIAQWPVPVHTDDTVETLAARVLKAEHRLLPMVVEAAAENGKIVRLPIDATSFTASDGNAEFDRMLSKSTIHDINPE